MPCSGCARRRAKMQAAYTAFKQGITSAKKSYGAAAINQESLQERKKGTLVNVTDIREKQA